MVEPQLTGDECVYRKYTPTPSAQVFLEDMNVAICHSDKCEYKNDACNHGRLSVELLKAMLDYYASIMDKNGNDAAANLLRSEL